VLGPDTLGPAWVRLHALAGAIPLAGYLVLHLGSQAVALAGAQPYSRVMGAIDSLPLMIALEVAGIYAPLAFHVVAGFGLMRGRQLRAGSVWVGEGGRTWQSASGVVVLGFIAVHFWQFRWRLWTGELDRSDFYPELCASLSSTAFGGVPLVAVGYLLGVAAAAFHMAQGLFHACLRWELAPRRVAARCCGALGAALFLLGALTVIELATGSVRLHFLG
jgi:succinate dehydrogenase / fumarate reductase cytochrome b subunit